MLLIWSVLLNVRSSKAGESGQGIKTLKGSVEHTERLSPVEPAFRIGATLNVSKLPKFVAGNKWYVIPHWLAGKWHQDKQTTYYSYDYETEEADRSRHETTARGDDELGWQQDRRGGIWQYENAPYIAVVEGDGYFAVQIIKMSEPVSVSEKQVVLRFRGIDLHVDSDTKRIVASSQNEKLQVYTQSDYGPGYSRCVASIKSFDEDGKPSRLSQAATISVQRQLFTPTNDYKGKDMKQLFRQYLFRGAWRI
jgi:hypothetical protein